VKTRRSNGVLVNCETCAYAGLPSRLFPCNDCMPSEWPRWVWENERVAKYPRRSGPDTWETKSEYVP